MANTDTTNKAPTPAKPKVDAKPKVPPRALVSVKAGAMSTDVGPAIVATLDRSYKDETEANRRLDQVQEKRYDVLAQLTAAFVKAKKADDSINLKAVFVKDTKAKNDLYDQLGLAVGLREKVTVGKGDKAKERIVTAKAVSKYLTNAKLDPKSDDYKRMETLRTNLAHTVKKCIQAAYAVIEEGIVLKSDKASGTLAISGPKVQSYFGAPEVLLNEKQNQGGKELSHKPSYQELVAIGASKAGAAVHKRTDSRKTTTPAAAPQDPETAISSLCHTLVQGLARLGGTKPSEKMRTALQSAQSAINKTLQVV